MRVKKIMLCPELADKYAIEAVLSENLIQLELLLVEQNAEKKALAYVFKLDSFQDAIINGIRETAQYLLTTSLPGILPIKEIIWDEVSLRLFVLHDIADLVPLSTLVDESIKLPEDGLWKVASDTAKSLKAFSSQNSPLGAHMGISITSVFITDIRKIEEPCYNFNTYLGLPCLDQALHPCMLAENVFKKSMCAPELFSTFIPDIKSDLYSLGTVLYTLAMLRKPFSLHTTENLLQSMKDREYLPLTGYSTNLISFIESLLNPDIAVRLSLDDIFLEPQIQKQDMQSSASASKGEDLLPIDQTTEPGSRSKSSRQTDLSTEPDQDGNTTLMRHVKRNNWYIAQRFVDTQTRIYNHHGMTALMLAARLGFDDIVKELIPYEAGLQSPSPDFEGYTALMFAAQRRNQRCVELLLDKESGLVTKSGRTALMLAATNNDLECIKLLLPREGGMQDSGGWSSLMDATLVRRLDAIDILGNQERNLKTNQGHTAQDLANLFVIDEERSIVTERLKVFETS